MQIIFWIENDPPLPLLPLLVLTWSNQPTDFLSGPPNFANDALFQMNCTRRGHHAGVEHLTNSTPLSSSPDCDVTSHVGLKYLKQQFGVRNKSRRCDF